MLRSTRLLAVRFATAAAVATVLLPASAATAAPGVSPISDFPARGQLTYRGNSTVITQIDGSSAALLVGKAGAVPYPAKGALSLPAWGQPHLGTDAARKPVVVYPHCSEPTDVRTCDLRVYGLLTGKDVAVPGVNAAGVGETEGVMDRGAVAFARWTATDQPRALALAGHADERTTVLYRAVGAAARVVTKQGGQQLALDRGRILQVRDSQPGYGNCGRPAVELLRTDRKAAALRLADYGCGLNDQTITAPTFVDGWIMWGVRTIEGDVIARLKGSLVRNSEAEVGYATVPGGFAVAAPSARSGARLLIGDLGDDPTVTKPTVHLANVIGLSFTAKRP